MVQIHHSHQFACADERGSLPDNLPSNAPLFMLWLKLPQLTDQTTSDSVLWRVSAVKHLCTRQLFVFWISSAISSSSAVSGSTRYVCLDVLCCSSFCASLYGTPIDAGENGDGGGGGAIKRGNTINVYNVRYGLRGHFWNWCELNDK